MHQMLQVCLTTVRIMFQPIRAAGGIFRGFAGHRLAGGRETVLQFFEQFQGALPRLWLRSQQAENRGKEKPRADGYREARSRIFADALIEARAALFDGVGNFLGGKFWINHGVR